MPISVLKTKPGLDTNIVVDVTGSDTSIPHPNVGTTTSCMLDDASIDQHNLSDENLQVMSVNVRREPIRSISLGFCPS